jgi:hypothetical protein
MKLTLELSDGRQTAIKLEEYGDTIQPKDRLQTLQGLCVLLDSWATEIEKDEQA